MDKAISYHLDTFVLVKYQFLLFEKVISKRGDFAQGDFVQEILSGGFVRGDFVLIPFLTLLSLVPTACNQKFSDTLQGGSTLFDCNPCMIKKLSTQENQKDKLGCRVLNDRM